MRIATRARASSASPRGSRRPRAPSTGATTRASARRDALGPETGRVLAEADAPRLVQSRTPALRIRPHPGRPGILHTWRAAQTPDRHLDPRRDHRQRHQGQREDRRPRRAAACAGRRPPSHAIPSPQAIALKRSPSGSRVSAGPARGASDVQQASSRGGQRAATASAHVVAKQLALRDLHSGGEQGQAADERVRGQHRAAGDGRGQEHRGQDQVVRMHDARDVEGQEQGRAARDQRVRGRAAPELLAQEPDADRDQQQVEGAERDVVAEARRRRRSTRGSSRSPGPAFRPADSCRRRRGRRCSG